MFLISCILKHPIIFFFITNITDKAIFTVVIICNILNENKSFILMEKKFLLKNLQIIYTSPYIQQYPKQE